MAKAADPHPPALRCPHLQVFASQIIAATGAVPELLAPAASYMRVRAAAQPALLVSIVAQSCLLAQRDSRSPAEAVLLQVAVNAALDVYLIVSFGAGVVGAAWATVAAQYLGMALLLWRLRRTGRVKLRLLAGLAGGLRDLWKTLAPLVVVYVARNLCYMRLQVRCSFMTCSKFPGRTAIQTSAKLLKLKEHSLCGDQHAPGSIQGGHFVSTQEPDTITSHTEPSLIKLIFEPSLVIGVACVPLHLLQPVG